MSKHTIPTELNIAPRGKSWLNGQLIDGVHGYPTRQSMENAERAAFEKWARFFGTWDVEQDDDPNFSTTGYTDITVNVAWLAWQARAALAATAAGSAVQCTCPSGDGSLQWPCPAHPPTASTLAAPAAAAPVVLPEPDAWAALHFSGKRAGKIYNTCDTKSEIDAYINQVEQSSDSITLRAAPIYLRAAPKAQADARDVESDYQRGYRHGYNRRDAEVQGALL